MSDPRDELLDKIHLELYHLRRVIHRAFEQTRGGSGEAVYAYAAGQCLASFEQLLKELEALKQSRSKSKPGADDSAAPG